MSGWGWLPIVGVVLTALLLAGWLAWTANRLDRLHVRREAAEASFRGCLLRRSALASELATTGLSDPASAILLLDAAGRARDASDDDWVAESLLSEMMRVLVLPDASDEPLVARLHEAARQASMARRIHNDLAARAIDLRARRRVRWFHLAGHSQPPSMIELDDGQA